MFRFTTSRKSIHFQLTHCVAYMQKAHMYFMSGDRSWMSFQMSMLALSQESSIMLLQAFQPMAMQLSNKRCTGTAISKKAAALLSFCDNRCSLKNFFRPMAIQPSNKKAKTSSCYISRYGPWLLHYSWTCMAYFLDNIHTIHLIYDLRNTFFIAWKFYSCFHCTSIWFLQSVFNDTLG